MQKVRHFPMTAFLILFQDLINCFKPRTEGRLASKLIIFSLHFVTPDEGVYGSFHHSLTVLIHYQSLKNIVKFEGGPPIFQIGTLLFLSQINTYTGPPPVSFF